MKNPVFKPRQPVQEFGFFRACFSLFVWFCWPLVFLVPLFFWAAHLRA